MRSARLVPRQSMMRPSLAGEFPALVEPDWVVTNWNSMIARARFPGALGAATAANLRRGALPSHVQAIALLIPHQRAYSTDPSTSQSSSSQSYPPPGFNAKQAKESIPQDKKDAQQAESKDGQAGESESAVTQSREEDKARLKELDAAKMTMAEDGKRVPEEKKEPQKKLTIGQKIKKEAHHYWDGTKLLATEVRISTRLAMKMAGGYELTRREHRQVCCDDWPKVEYGRRLISGLYMRIAATNCQGPWPTGPVLDVCSLSLR